MSATLAGDVDVLERIGTALADPTRRRILTMLLVAPAYPAELAEVLDVSRTNMSNHLACLRWSRRPREGRQIRYELVDDRLAGALRQLARVVLDSPACPAHLEPTHDHHPPRSEPGGCLDRRRRGHRAAG